MKMQLHMSTLTTNNSKNRKFIFDQEYDLKLIAERGISFQDIINAIMNNLVVACELYPNQTERPGQSIIYVLIDDEVYVVPCVEDHNCIHLKRAFPNSKAHWLYKPFPGYES